MKYFRNPEIKSMAIKIMILFIGVIFSIIYVSYKDAEILNKNYIKQNILIVGNILAKNPDMEEEVIKGIIAKDNSNYSFGEKIVSKYSYNTLSLKENHKVFNVFKGFMEKIMFIIVVFLLILIILISTEFINFYKNIETFTIAAEKAVDGVFYNLNEEYNEGEFYIFSNQFNVMINRFKNSVQRLKDEKIFLKNTIADISHQIKTPLSSLIMFNDLMKDERMSKEDKNYFIKLSEEQLKRMEWLIKNLLKIARLDAGVIEFNIKKNPLNITMTRALAPLKEKAKEKNISINIDLNDNIRFNHDIEWTSEAISNIIKNSIEHTKNEGYIDIICKETSLSIDLTIKDNGEGIPKNILPNIFKRFYKGESSVNPQSIGIGLSLSKSIIESQNGSIIVRSKEGQGTVFNIIFLKTII